MGAEPRQPPPDRERLHKFLARAGVASRRQAEALIQAGRVRLNGMIVTQMGVQIDPRTAQVEVDGQPVRLPERLLTLMLHKPLGYVTTLKDPQGRRQVSDLLTGVPVRVFPIGRLDYDTSGLLLLTNDGELAHRLMHPRYKVAKTYRVTVAGRLSAAARQRLAGGLELDGRRTAPAAVGLVRASDAETVFDLTIHEGRNRQVRRMAAAVGYPVLNLHRIAYGPLRLGRLTPGTYRELTPAEVSQLWLAGNKESTSTHHD